MEQTPNNTKTLKRLLGMPSMIAVGAGVAIGSGILRVPGVIAENLHTPTLILLAWLAAGTITMLQSLASAELATRYPQAGGEYQYLKYAYGDFAAFVFGWCCTIFISGAGIAAIAAALGDFAASLFGLAHWNHTLGGLSIAIVVCVNCLGLRQGAIAQNALTGVKVLALVGIAAGAVWMCGRATPAPIPAGEIPAPSLAAFGAAMLQAFWCFTGATDSVRLAEEVHDARRDLPRALIGTTLLVTLIYVAFNYALLCAATPAQMAGRQDAHTLAFAASTLPVREVILVVSIVICIGCMSAALLANSRVLFAMARDRLAFAMFARMSGRQAPVASLTLLGGISVLFTLSRSFEQILQVYFLGAAILFGLVYLSVLIFRWRERATDDAARDDIYRLPAATIIVAVLLVFEAAIGYLCIRSSPEDSQMTIGVFAIIAIAYLFVRRYRRSTG
ncbi:MAG TPA: APC family permease [Phycisphaerae bacterium]|nr:APC family permease [Phycisphaerae bacterium]HRW55655.1 APC family permease [Phycisphaerae bacterium]